MLKPEKNIILPTEEEDRLINAAIAADEDTAEVSDEMFDRMQPVAKTHPHIPPRVRGPQRRPTKQSTTLRLDAEVVEFFKSQGRGWQTRMNAVLLEHVRQQRSS